MKNYKRKTLYMFLPWHVACAIDGELLPKRIKIEKKRRRREEPRGKRNQRENKRKKERKSRRN
jgi:hypothetical protein